MFVMLLGVMVFTFFACGGSNKNQEASDGENKEAAEEVEKAAEPEKADTVKGPTILECENFDVNVPEGWYVKSKGSNSCTLEPLVSPNIDGKSNFGWRVDISALSGDVFKAEKFIEDDKKVFENTKKMPDLKLNGVNYMYNFYDYEFGKHSVLAASLPSAGAIQVKVGGYDVKDKDVDAILKSLKLK